MYSNCVYHNSLYNKQLVHCLQHSILITPSVNVYILHACNFNCMAAFLDLVAIEESKDHDLLTLLQYIITIIMPLSLGN